MGQVMVKEEEEAERMAQGYGHMMLLEDTDSVPREFGGGVL